MAKASLGKRVSAGLLLTALVLGVRACHNEFSDGTGGASADIGATPAVPSNPESGDKTADAVGGQAKQGVTSNASETAASSVEPHFDRMPKTGDQVVSLGNYTLNFVWVDAQAKTTGSQLLVQRQTDPRLLAPYVACHLPEGTPAFIVDRGWFLSEVLVTAGPFRGCRGMAEPTAFKPVGSVLPGELPKVPRDKPVPPAPTGSVKLTADSVFRLTGHGQGRVTVWRDFISLDRAYQLKGDGSAAARAYKRLEACSVPVGTRVLPLDEGLDVMAVMIVEGPDKGCRGVVPTPDVG